MYPAAASAVSWTSCKRSLSGVIQNTMTRLSEAAEIGSMDTVIKAMAAHRREMEKLRKIAEMAEATRKRKEAENAALHGVLNSETEAARLDRAKAGTVNSIWKHKKRGPSIAS